MPINPYFKGGADIAITDGGTNASDASTALSNLNATLAGVLAVGNTTGTTDISIDSGDSIVGAGSIAITGPLSANLLNVGIATSAVAQGDFAAGDGVRQVFYDASANILTIDGAAASVDSNNALTIGGTSATALTLGRSAVGVSMPSWLNIAAAASAVAVGDFAAGDGTRTMFWDASAGTIALTGTTTATNILTLLNQTDSVGTTPGLKVFNTEGATLRNITFQGVDYSGATTTQQGTGINIIAGSNYSNNTPSNFIGGSTSALYGGDSNGAGEGGWLALASGRGSWNRNTSAVQGTGGGGQIVIYTPTIPADGGWTARWSFHSSGHLIAGIRQQDTPAHVDGDNLYDIGSHDGGTTSSRPRTAYVGTSVVVAGAATLTGTTLDTTGALTIGGTSATALTLGRSAVGVTAPGWLNIGSSTGASALGDFSTGDGTQEMLYDANVGSLTLTDPGSTNYVKLLAGTGRIQAHETTTSTTGEVQALLTARKSSGTAVAGFATRWTMALGMNTGTLAAAGEFIASWTNPTQPSPVSDLDFYASVGGLSTSLLKLRGADSSTVTQGPLVFGGHVTAGIDNTYDIGNSGALRPRTVYVGTSLDIGSSTLTSSALTGNTIFSVLSTGVNALTLDSGTTGAVNLGTNANAKTITIGNTTAGTKVAFPTGTEVTGIARIKNGTAIVATDTADAGERMVYDPSGGTFTLNAPAAPVIGDRWGVKNRTSSVAAITINGNTKNIEAPNASFALAASFSLSGDGVAVTWEYDGTQWIVI